MFKNNFRKTGSRSKYAFWKPRVVIRLLMLFILSLLASEICAQTETAKTIITQEERIVSLAPHITELLFAVGAGEDIVGTVAYSDYPLVALEIPNIGNANDLNYEAILALKPTLVFAWESGNGTETLNKLRSLGLVVHSHDPTKLDDIATSLEAYGKFTGRFEQGKLAANNYRERLKNLRLQYSGKPEIRVFYQLWNEPMMTINSNHLISDVITLCRGENVFSNAIPLVPKISIESVIAASPEAIIASGMADERPAWLDDWRKWPSIPAVENEHLFSIHPDLLHRHSPRILDGAKLICDSIDKAR